MSPEKEAQLRAMYPLVYGEPFLNGENFRCSDGWFGILHALGLVLTHYINEAPKEEHRRQYHAVQVKEKFGTLRFYLNGIGTSEMDGAIRAAEAISSFVCEECGAPGKLRRAGYVRTLCDTCLAEWEAARAQDALNRV